LSPKQREAARKGSKDPKERRHREPGANPAACCQATSRSASNRSDNGATYTQSGGEGKRKRR